MKVALLVEHDNAKDGSRYKKYGEQSREGAPEWFKKMVEEGTFKVSSWADNTGHMRAQLTFYEIVDEYTIDYLNKLI